MSTQHDYILGLNTYDHDVSACLLRDGAIAFAIAKERITRQKHASGFYREVVDYCLKAEGITLDDVGLIVRNCYILPVGEMEQRLLHQDMPYYFSADERKQAAGDPLFLSHSDKVVTVSHHLAHAYSAFAACPFDEGAIMVVDGVGSYRADVTESVPPGNDASALARESESYYRFAGSEIAPLKKIWMEPARGFLNQEFYNMPGLGAVYSRVSIYVFADWNKCGEVMGLAPYGHAGQVAPLLELKDDGQVAVREWPDEFNQPWLSGASQGWEKSAAVPHWENLAWRVQDDAEKILLARAKWLREVTGAKNLCMAGGVALNCVANGRIAREAGFDNVWVQPAAGDDGIAIGCAYYGHLAVRNKPRSFVMKHAYLGVDYGDDELRGLINRPAIRLATTTTVSTDICADTARALAAGEIVGWFQGRSEFGPRALGNRSILADPRQPAMKDHLNMRVKHRQAFRPFAPVVPLERAADIFVGGMESPFMLLAEAVRPEWRERIPAIVHVDGTARVQTVRQEDNPRLYALLQEFERLTGVPVLLNTSFNVKGEPIVETPADALACFLGTGIDCLVVHDVLIRKTKLHRLLSPLVQVYSEVGAIVRTGLGQQPSG